MGFSVGGSDKTTTTNFNQNSNPWSPAIPYLQNFLKSAGGVGGINITPDQQTDFGVLKQNAAQGNPWDTAIANTANNQLGYSTAPLTSQVSGAYSGLQDSLNKYATGAYLDPTKNPEIQGLLSTVGDDISNRINQQFAGAGRDLSGMNQQAIARGISQGEAPILLDQFNTQQQNQINAANALQGGAINAANANAGLASNQSNINSQGIQTAQSALDAANYAPNQELKLDQQIQQLPYENLALLGSVLFPTAGLGGQTSGTSTANTTGVNAGFGVNLLSDERAKDDIAEIGAMADGTKMFRYRYKGDPTVRVGPIAQDVERRTPSAVDNDGPAGLKTVDLDAATAKAAEIVRNRLKKRAN